LLFVTASVTASLLCHYYIRFYFIASIVAALLATLILQIVFYIELGYLSEFYQIAMITSGGMAFIVALLVGIPFKRKRRKAAD